MRPYFLCQGPQTKAMWVFGHRVTSQVAGRVCGCCEAQSQIRESIDSVSSCRVTSCSFLSEFQKRPYKDCTIAPLRNFSQIFPLPRSPQHSSDGLHLTVRLLGYTHII